MGPGIASEKLQVVLSQGDSRAGLTVVKQRQEFENGKKGKGGARRAEWGIGWSVRKQKGWGSRREKQRVTGIYKARRLCKGAEGGLVMGSEGDKLKVPEDSGSDRLLRGRGELCWAGDARPERLLCLLSQGSALSPRAPRDRAEPLAPAARSLISSLSSFLGDEHPQGPEQS